MRNNDERKRQPNMDMIGDKWTPAAGVNLWRSGGLLLLALTWLLGRGGEAGVILLLFLAVMALARWRFAMPGWAALIDMAACLAAIPFWEEARFGLAIPLFEGMLAGRLWLALPVLIALIGYGEVSLPLVAVLAQAAFAGLAIRGWSMQTSRYRQEADRTRQEKYELDHLRHELLAANVQSARMAELTERHRIAQLLHDDAGHELTAALLALQAFEQLRREGDPQADDMFLQARRRLSDGMERLRTTVHNMIPTWAIGLSRLEDICRDYAGCPVRFAVNGDTTKVPAYLWSMLEACLKEALTNVSRHADASKVDVDLDVGVRIVRLCVKDDGKGGAGVVPGIGLRNLRQRARAVGGSVTTDASDGFCLVCVLPLND